MFNTKTRVLYTLVGTALMAGCAGSSYVVPVQNLTDPDIKKSDGWSLVWSDEFNGSEIDESKWSFEENCWGGGNMEQQCYTARDKNAFVEGGVLYLVAHEETFTGPNNPNGDYTKLAHLPYTSARLRSTNKGDWTYGRFEIRAKMPIGQGTWPAIWMLPTDYTYGTWAASGEIDIVEAVNLKAPSDSPEYKGQEESRIYGTLHYGAVWPDNKHSGQAYYLPNGANPADDFHTYSLEWEKDEMRWYVDDVHYATQTSDGWYALYSKDGEKTLARADAPFDQRFHLLLNLAVGGSWSGNTNNKGVDASMFPQALEVDYVRVYECSKDPVTGQGCATIQDSATKVEGNLPPLVVDLPADFTTGERIDVFNGELNEFFRQNAYDPQGVIMDFAYVTDAQRGQVMEITKTADTGNIYFETPQLDMSSWANNAKLVFDIKVVEINKGNQISVKLDSGWPNVSDLSVTLPRDKAWHTIEIDMNELVSNGNSHGVGKVDMSKIKNVLVIDPLGEMKFQLDNVRFERN
ncbi:glycoside hydrolase family 16 protein [Vibrio sp. SM6]|uniref:Glycoside hydrolase family 16 protein n=1 Tax=Vibrio agarilyticus TaxID=2726741 RepID=A0A7X8TT21_9VIBR|nr:glycoside hydrolase family 16 protein [Vibrio agarilyticus]NLS14057.1 glycoside hydrolase family 16 protein [Vibrio agarilyticus]